MKTKHSETTLAELKAQCALALPLFEGRALTAGVTPQAAHTAFDLLPDDEKLAFIAAVMEEIETTRAANQLTAPTSAAPTTPKMAMSPEMSAGKRAWIAAQRAKFGGFRLS